MEIGNNETVEVRKNELIPLPELNNALKKIRPDFPAVRAIKQYPGGYSNLTYLVETDGQSYVLRRPPAGAKDIKGGHDIAREYRILTALQTAGFGQIPPPVLLYENEDVAFAPFYLMEKVDGLIFRAGDANKFSHANNPPDFRRLSEGLCDNLVNLHSVDIQKSGLINIGKPVGYVQRQVTGWQQRYAKAQTDEIAEMDFLAEWLQQHLPQNSQPPTLLHNDYKYDNVVFSTAENPRINALLDWEMATVGDPLMDVGTALSYWSEAADGPFEKSFNLTWLPGNLSRNEFAERYARQSGRDLTNLLYYYVFGLFKNSVIMQQIYARYRQGKTTDTRFAGLIDGVKTMSRKAVFSVESNQMK